MKKSTENKLKEAKEYLKEVNSLTTREELYKIGTQMQIDAWNEALDKAAESVVTILHKSGKQIEVITPILEPQFYEKGNGDLVSQGYAQVGTNKQLKYENESIVVDKQSILKLKK